LFHTKRFTLKICNYTKCGENVGGDKVEKNATICIPELVFFSPLVAKAKVNLYKVQKKNSIT
jgi:hypothetical protein